MENNWKVLVLLLKEIAIDKFGIGYQLKLAELTGLKQGNLSRLFSLKYAPNLKTFLIITHAIKVNFYFEDIENKSNLNILLEKAMDDLGRRPNKLNKN